MHHITKSILVPYTPEELFALVNDVARYPEFMPWCGGAEVISREGNALTAKIDIAFGVLKQSFSTRNINHPPARIDVALVDGPFKALDGCWRFQPLGAQACKVIFELKYSFASATVETLINPVFSLIANSFVDAFAKRAAAVYGART